MAETDAVSISHEVNPHATERNCEERKQTCHDTRVDPVSDPIGGTTGIQGHEHQYEPEKLGSEYCTRSACSNVEQEQVVERGAEDVIGVGARQVGKRSGPPTRHVASPAGSEASSTPGPALRWQA